MAMPNAASRPPTNSSATLYEKQARLLAARAPPGEQDFHALFARDLRKLMQASRRAASNAPDGPLLNAFFGWGVLPGTEVTIGKIALKSGKYEGPATVGVDRQISRGKPPGPRACRA